MGCLFVATFYFSDRSRLKSSLLQVGHPEFYCNFISVSTEQSTVI